MCVLEMGREMGGKPELGVILSEKHHTMHPPHPLFSWREVVNHHCSSHPIIPSSSNTHTHTKINRDGDER